jgi:hypothetical protein
MHERLNEGVNASGAAVKVGYDRVIPRHDFRDVPFSNSPLRIRCSALGKHRSNLEGARHV